MLTLAKNTNWFSKKNWYKVHTQETETSQKLYISFDTLYYMLRLVIRLCTYKVVLFEVQKLSKHSLHEIPWATMTVELLDCMPLFRWFLLCKISFLLSFNGFKVNHILKSSKFSELKNNIHVHPVKEFVATNLT